MKIIILHLSDIHIRAASDSVLTRGGAIASALYGSLPDASHVFVVVSGDIAFSGVAEEYKWAAALLEDIRTNLTAEAKCGVSIVLAPGNHDCDFKTATAARRHVIGGLLGNPSPEVDDSVIEQCTSVQQSFFAFRNAVENRTPASDDGLWRTQTHQLGSRIIAFDTLNIAWMSQKSETQGRLYFPVERYAGGPIQDADFRVVVLHHPFNWLAQPAYRPLRQLVRRVGDLVLTGHEHRGNLGINEDTDSGLSVFVEGSVLQPAPGDSAKSSFHSIIVDLSKNQFSSTQYQWTGERYAKCDQGSWTDLRELPRKQINPFPLDRHFAQFLDDPGGAFRHPGSASIALSDLFVYPDLHSNAQDSSPRKYVSSSVLTKATELASGVLLSGEEKVGRTTLIKHLYRHFHARGFVPILLAGRDLTKAAAGDLDRTIARALSNQYGEEFVEPYLQQTLGNKILFIDDFEESSVRSADYRRELLTNIQQRFSGVIIVVDDVFEYSTVSAGSIEVLGSFNRFRVQPFGYRLRAQLIAKWFAVGADGSMDESAHVGRCSQAEKLMDQVMKRALIPSLPIYLLTLLQSIEAGKSSGFKDSALGYYYQYLLLDALQTTGVRAEKLTEHIQYCTHLAWYFHKKDSKALSEAALRTFNAEFSHRWHSVNFEERLETLLRARVLNRDGDDLCFRYPYIYYYLKGDYLSHELSDPEIRKYVSHCCQHLYVREHANTVLFLAHHTKDEFVLASIVDALRKLFVGSSPVQFGSDSNAIAQVIDDAPKLKYGGGDPDDHRAQRNAMRDRFDDGRDGLAEREEESDTLSLAAQWTTLMKTTEILGQVLKNQYSAIERIRKAELLRELFNGPLRALSDFYRFVATNQDSLVSLIEAALERLGKVPSEQTRKTLARRVAQGLILGMSYFFLRRAAESATSDSLSEDVRDVVEANPSVAYRLIELAILLDSPKAIPKGKIRLLLKDIKSQAIASRLLQIIVVNRLYMFRTSEGDMQWLQSESIVDLGQQHKISYVARKGRRLK